MKTLPSFTHELVTPSYGLFLFLSFVLFAKTIRSAVEQVFNQPITPLDNPLLRSIKAAVRCKQCETHISDAVRTSSGRCISQYRSVIHHHLGSISFSLFSHFFVGIHRTS
jgi:hypothetical protein